MNDLYLLKTKVKKLKEATGENADNVIITRQIPVNIWRFINEAEVELMGAINEGEGTVVSTKTGNKCSYVFYTTLNAEAKADFINGRLKEPEGFFDRKKIGMVKQV